MSNGNLPSDVDVNNINSPKIDAIKKATERVSNWLHNDLREIIKPLQNLHTLPDDIADLKKRLVEQFRRLFVGQISAEMKSREANIRVAKRKADLVETHITRKKDQLEESQERVRTRYEKLAESVSQDHKADLERLDDHAYQITDEIYPDQIQNRFSYESPVFWESMAEHSAKSATARTKCLEEGIEEAADEVSSFLDERDEFYEDVRRKSSLEVEPGKYQLSYWFVETEDESTGKRRIDVLFPWDLHDTDCPVGDDQEEAIRNAARAQIQDESLGRPLSKKERAVVVDYIKEETDATPSTLQGEESPRITVSL